MNEKVQLIERKTFVCPQCGWRDESLNLFDVYMKHAHENFVNLFCDNPFCPSKHDDGLPAMTDQEAVKTFKEEAVVNPVARGVPAPDLSDSVKKLFQIFNELKKELIASGQIGPDLPIGVKPSPASGPPELWGGVYRERKPVEDRGLYFYLIDCIRYFREQWGENPDLIYLPLNIWQELLGSPTPGVIRSRPGNTSFFNGIEVLLTQDGDEYENRVKDYVRQGVPVVVWKEDHFRVQYQCVIVRDRPAKEIKSVQEDFKEAV